jgi:hypothetical protein
MLWNMPVMNNSGVGNISLYPEIKVSGTYYRLQTTSAPLANGSQNTNFTAIGYIAEAGEIIAINTATNNGAMVSAGVVQFDNTCLLYSSKLTSLSAGDNTVYTVPSGKTATLLSAVFGTSIGSIGAMVYVNASGGARTFSWKFKPSGGSATLLAPSQSPGDGTRTQVATALSMAAGDSIIINTDAATATQFAWVNVMEI